MQAITWRRAVKLEKDAGRRARFIQGGRTMSMSPANRAQTVVRNSKRGQYKPLEYRYTIHISTSNLDLILTVL